ncbi:MAG: Sec-independent protein translocase protein TatB [Symbiobacterium sp.]|uniref:Sec-independent protein translocase protein TatB n=1 Tax=Symbiobacterium sp. TaxID=1971213 RepID=UPI0034641CC4
MVGNLGFSEVLVILIVALVVFGPEKLPQLGRSLGQAMREFRRATQSLTEEVTRAAAEEVREGIDKGKKESNDG